MPTGRAAILRGAHQSRRRPPNIQKSASITRDLPNRVAEAIDALPPTAGEVKATVGLLVMRSYVLAGNAGHYDGVISALEARGLRVIPAFATGLDARPAIEKFFLEDGHPTIDAMVSLMGFSLVGGPAYNDAKAAQEILVKLDVPYIAAHPVEFQTLEQWRGIGSRAIAGRSRPSWSPFPNSTARRAGCFRGPRKGCSSCTGCEQICLFPETRALATCILASNARICSPRGSRSSPCCAGPSAPSAKSRSCCSTFRQTPGIPAQPRFLSVFESLHRLLGACKARVTRVERPPASTNCAPRSSPAMPRVIGAGANVHARIPTEDHVRRERWLRRDRSAMGSGAGTPTERRASILVLGERFGNIFVGIQPAFGYEGDPMRLLFEKGFSPTHAFSAFYRWLKEDFGAHAVLHFGTHGALEFMPGKQSGSQGPAGRIV